MIGPLQKSAETFAARQSRSSVGRVAVALPFGPAIQVRRGGLWAKHMGLKRGAVGNTLGTLREHVGNNGKMKKSS